LDFIFFCTTTFIILLLIWSFQKQKAGILLLNIGENENLWMTQAELILAYIFLVGYNTWSLFEQALRGNLQYASLVTKISDPAFWLSLAIGFILQEFSRTEFRSNGICIYFWFIPWRRIKSYNWEPSKPNILTIQYKPRFPLFSTWMSSPIPTQSQEAVDRILNERLQDKSLSL
jgi:hypothetical protein